MLTHAYRRQLERLARRYGVQPTYEDVAKRVVKVSPEALVRALQILGAPIHRPEDAADALRARRQAEWRQMLEPATVAWDGHPAVLALRVREDRLSKSFRCRIMLESGEARQFGGRVGQLLTWRKETVEGVRYVMQCLALPVKLPWGYHCVAVDVAGETAETLVIAAPKLAYREPSERRPWGVFLPLYALHRRTSQGAGDFSDLEALMHWVAGQGGSLVATLPLLASLWELSDDPSPYAPASRLFWNEFYVDLRRLPELAESPEARELLAASASSSDASTRVSPPLLDYPRRMAAKRRIMELLADVFFRGASPDRGSFDEFCRRNPEAESFAQFRAVGERQGRPWTEWPAPLCDGTIGPADYDPATYRYHVYAQWQVTRQLQTLADRARRDEMLWYLDFPLGVSGIGYDVWRHRELFVAEAAGGAPPDAFFTAGQNWGFSPLHPEAIRRDGYRYLIAVLRRHLSYARLLRIDHVMGLHRLYWVPEGMHARDGVYVHYPRDELFAVLTLESHRHRARIIGENLGTVPAVLNQAMRRHGVGDMYVVQYEWNLDAEDLLRPVPAESVASVNTHDMPTFAAFWTGLDIDDRVLLGLLTPDEAVEQRESRAAMRRATVALLRRKGFLSRVGQGRDAHGGTAQTGPAATAVPPSSPSACPTLPGETFDTAAILEALLALLAASPAEVVLVSLEDLWQETQPQNVPGTSTERPNWRRPAQYSLEEFSSLPEVMKVLATVARAREFGLRAN